MQKKPTMMPKMRASGNPGMVVPTGVSRAIPNAKIKPSAGGNMSVPPKLKGLGNKIAGRAVNKPQMQNRLSSKKY